VQTGDGRDEEQAAPSILVAAADSDDRVSDPSPKAMESLSSVIDTGNHERPGAGENPPPPANPARHHLASPHFPFKRHYLAAFLTLPRACTCACVCDAYDSLVHPRGYQSMHHISNRAHTLKQHTQTRAPTKREYARAHTAFETGKLELMPEARLGVAA
jgi:hypothetical protein